MPLISCFFVPIDWMQAMGKLFFLVSVSLFSAHVRVLCVFLAKAFQQGKKHSQNELGSICLQP